MTGGGVYVAAAALGRRQQMNKSEHMAADSNRRAKLKEEPSKLLIGLYLNIKYYTSNCDKFK